MGLKEKRTSQGELSYREHFSDESFDWKVVRFIKNNLV
jgi:hypothetical protein